MFWQHCSKGQLQEELQAIFQCRLVQQGYKYAKFCSVFVSMLIKQYILLPAVHAKCLWSFEWLQPLLKFWLISCQGCGSLYPGCVTNRMNSHSWTRESPYKEAHSHFNTSFQIICDSVLCVVWCGVEWFVVVCCMWCGVVWCGVIWCGVLCVVCEVVCCVCVVMSCGTCLYCMVQTNF
jgi:hypothetical protein